MGEAKGVAMLMDSHICPVVHVHGAVMCHVECHSGLVVPIAGERGAPVTPPTSDTVGSRIVPLVDTEIPTS